MPLQKDTLKDALERAKLASKELQALRQEGKPLWKGPEVDGITFSLLSRYLVCKERFRIMTMEGLVPESGFDHKIEFGNMWHVAEEALAAGVPSRRWETDLLQYAQRCARRYPTQTDLVDHWYNVCLVTFPAYVDHWKAHKDVVRRIPLLQEQVFGEPYKLPSGRTVKLKGKFDSVDLRGATPDISMWLQENKTKGRIMETQLKRQLKYDLQSMIYVVGLECARANSLDMSKPLLFGKHTWDKPFGGVVYNVIRRPLSGGKGTIVRRKPTKAKPRGESKTAYYRRLQEYILAEPETYFMRWEINLHQHDVVNFRRRCLDPILENLYDDWEWWTWCLSTKDGTNWLQTKGDVLYEYGLRSGQFPQHTQRHFIYPFGVYNPLNEGYATDLDEYILTGSTVGLRRIDTLFPELEVSP